MKHVTGIRQLKIFSIFLFVIVCIFLIGGVLIGNSLRQAQDDSIKNELESDCVFYIEQIYRQFDADYQTLNTLKGFIELESITEESLLEGINKSTKSNRFIRISVVSTDRVVHHATANVGITQEHYDDLNVDIKACMDESWSGKNSSSRVTYDHGLKQQVVVVSVPIMSGNEVVGVLAAYNSISEYQNILERWMRENSYVHIISQTGKFLVRTDNRMSVQESDSIYSMRDKYLNEDEVRVALNKREDYFSTFKYHGKLYCVYFMPIQYYNWYLIKISPYHTLQTSLIHQLNYSTLIYGIVISTVLIFMVYSYYILKKNVQVLQAVAYFDPLTGILNMSRFSELIEERVKTSSKCCIIRLNIKKFQLINDTFGEDYADNILCIVADNMLSLVSDEELCCREDSDQFAIFMQENSKETIVSRLKQFERTMKQYFEDTNSSYEIAFSIGICIDGSNSKTMMSNALWAMKEAKMLNQAFLFCDDYLVHSIKMQTLIETTMYKSLEQNEFHLYVQPKYDINSNEIVSVEALVRWIKEDGSMIYPNEFIPIFEKNGFCVDLDLYMLELVCKTVRDWLDRGLDVHPVSINQTKLLFYKTDYVDRISEIVSRYNLNPNYIILEILEGLALDDTKTFNYNIKRLHSKGFKVSLDDFGSGHSSLSNLNELNVDEIKIDRKFLAFKGDDSDLQKVQLLDNIIAMVTSLGYKVIVEGVETKEHVEILKRMNCNYAQGYYFSKPMKAADYETLLSRIS